jgi:hypothetical protein
MDEREIRVQTADGQMTTFIVHADGEGPFPVAVLYMDGVGYREQVKENARRFAADGYYCVVPDLFHRSGEKLSFDFTRMGEQEYRERLSSMVSAVKPDMVIGRHRGAFCCHRRRPGRLARAEGLRRLLHRRPLRPPRRGGSSRRVRRRRRHPPRRARHRPARLTAPRPRPGSRGALLRLRRERPVRHGRSRRAFPRRARGPRRQRRRRAAVRNKPRFRDGRPPRLRPRRRRTPLRAHARTLAEGTRTGDLRRDGVLRAKPGWAGTTRASRAFQPWSFGDRRAPPGACCDLARDVRGVRPP